MEITLQILQLFSVPPSEDNGLPTNSWPHVHLSEDDLGHLGLTCCRHEKDKFQCGIGITLKMKAIGLPLQCVGTGPIHWLKIIQNICQ